MHGAAPKYAPAGEASPKNDKALLHKREHPGGEDFLSLSEGFFSAGGAITRGVKVVFRAQIVSFEMSN